MRRSYNDDERSYGGREELRRRRGATDREREIESFDLEIGTMKPMEIYIFIHPDTKIWNMAI
jgi:hypothetical protein